MFSPREVQKKVLERIEFLRSTRVEVTEELVHQLYLAIMFEHLETSRTLLMALKLLAKERRAHHPEKGWIMVDQGQQTKLEDLCQQLEKEVRPS